MICCIISGLPHPLPLPLRLPTHTVVRSSMNNDGYTPFYDDDDNTTYDNEKSTMIIIIIIIISGKIIEEQ